MTFIHGKRCDLKTLGISLLLGGLSLGCEAMPSLAVPSETSDSGQVALTQTDSAPQFPDVQSATQAVRDAATPDAAVSAYSAGLALDGQNIPLQEAYVRRMVELNTPQTAEPAARRLVGISPGSSLAWAVLGFSEARRGNMVDGLTDIAVAARRLPDDPFIQRTAGELFAWYDNAPARPPLSPGVAADVDAARRALASQATFTQAYAKAGAFYKNPPRPDATAQGGVAGALPGAPEQAAQPPSTQTGPSSDQLTAPPPAYPISPVYTEPAVVPNYYSGDYYSQPVYPSPYASSYASGYDYPGCDLGCTFGFACPLLYLGGDWGWCGIGGFHHHWAGWSGGYHGYGYGSYGHGYAGTAFAHAYGGNAYGRSAYAGGGVSRAAPRAYSGYTSRSVSPGYVSRGYSAPRYSSAPRYAPSRSYAAPSRSYGSAGRSTRHYSHSGGGSVHSGGHSGGGSHSSGGGHHR